MSAPLRREVVTSDALALMRSLPEASIPLVVTDPPYGIASHSNHYVGKNPHAPVAGGWNFQIGPFLRECARILTDGGALYLFCRWDVSPLWLPYVSGCGLKVKTAIAWVKDNWSAGDLTGCFGNQYEQILFITKGRHVLRGHRWSNVWTFPRVPTTQLLHPTQKPTALLGRAIIASSDPGDVVLDPFCGSGSTGAAADGCGRGFLLSDVDPKMTDLTRRRLGLPLQESETIAAEPTPDYAPEWSDEWIVDPEELALLCDQMRHNRAALPERAKRGNETALVTTLW